MANDEEQQERRGFKVQDRRRFTESGDAKEDAGSSNTQPSEPVAAAAPAGARADFASAEAQATSRLEAASQAAHAEHPEHGEHSHEINFSTFIISLSTQAFAHLGEIPDPFSQQVQVDLHAARQMIDILGMLQDKTRSNLDSSEAQLLEGLLYDLRLRFVERSKR